MTTKHLYTMDSVIATLLYSLQIGDKTLSVHCSKEIVESGESDLLWKVLTLAWLLHPPNEANQYTRYNAFQKGDHKRFLESLVNSPFLLPPYEPHIAPPAPKPGVVEPKPIPWSTQPSNWTNDQAYRLWTTIQSSLCKKHWERATRLTLPLLHSDFQSVVSLLHAMNQTHMANLLESTDYVPLAERIVAHTFASIVSLPTNTVSTLDPLWNTATPVGRSGRRFTISPIALQIWQTQTNPCTDLMGCPILIGHSETTPYWAKILEKYGIVVKKKELIFKDDSSMEIFYSTYFPEDIPDEWSNEERKKSHGIEPANTKKENIWRPAFLLLR